MIDMDDEQDLDFVQMIIDLMKSTCDAIESARMSEDFMQVVDESLGQIPNIESDLQSPAENHANTSNSS